MGAKVGGFDRFGEAFDAVAESGVEREFIVAAEVALVAFYRVAVGVNLGAVAVEDEEVGMAAKGEIGFVLLAELLVGAGEPGLVAFPGGVIAVEPVGTVGAVGIGEVDAGDAEFGGGGGEGTEGEVAVVAVGHEAGGAVAVEAELFQQLGVDDRAE